MDQISDENGFEERADYIVEEDIQRWNVDIPYFKKIQTKLIEKGAKVLIGPRGTGKTHQMKIAYQSCLSDTIKPFAVYVSFSKYYYLEPLLSKNPAALTVFHTWVLCKILLRCCVSLEKNQGERPVSFCNNIEISQVEKFISQAEKNIQETWHSEIINNITIQYVLDIITEYSHKCGRKRAVLFLDDAALTLTKEYMIEFFDIFRSLKTITVSPKASVYPGTTEYGPRFHLKEDAEAVNIWFEPDGLEYSDFISQLCERRFANHTIDIAIKELLKYASFGNPRAFITLFRSYEEKSSDKIQVIFNDIINTHSKLLKDEYLSIKQKLNQYSTIIDTGWLFFEELINELTKINKQYIDNNKTEKQVIIGLAENTDNSIERMIKFLIEAGLLYKLSNVKHGDNREYIRYMPHLIFLFQKKAFSKSRGFNATEILEYLNRKNVKHPIRKDNIYNILDNDLLKNLKLDLPSCSNCGANRLSENQKYCHSCGNELISKSTFEKCLQLTIDELPFTEWQKVKIKKETTLKTVKDFLARTDIGDELQKPHGFGPKKAENIVNKVNKLIEEFLA
jgi:hypothetical protein